MNGGMSFFFFFFLLFEKKKKRDRLDRCTNQGFCAINSEFDISLLKENCKKNICEQNTELFISQPFEPSALPP
jgi:hypothetical protein